MALPELVTDAPPRTLTAAHLRRCWFRRLTHVEAGSLSLYEVECLYPSRQVSVPLGDLETARPVCNACQAAGIFRPDED